MATVRPLVIMLGVAVVLVGLAISAYGYERDQSGQSRIEIGNEESASTGRVIVAGLLTASFGFIILVLGMVLPRAAPKPRNASTTTETKENWDNTSRR